MEQRQDAARALWSELAQRVDALAGIVFAEDAPSSDAERAAGLRYLTRFLAAGLRLCVEHDDPEQPAFGRMVENSMSWGLDNPDCNYSWARIRGDAVYRIEGELGSARHLEFQVNSGHFADGRMPALSAEEGAWRTLSFLASDALETSAEGRFTITLSPDERPGNWLRTDGDASFVLVRQYFADWERERPGRFAITREDAAPPPPPLGLEELRRRFDRLFEWLETGARCWDRASRLLLSLEPNQLLMFDVADDVDRPGLHGQTYGMGGFRCTPDEVVILEFPVPDCRMWGLALSSFWWESLEFGSRQSSLNSHQAKVDADGVFRGVIAHGDPGIPNWIDPEGSQRGSLALRFLFADTTPKPSFRVVPRGELRQALPARTPHVSPEERARALRRRSRALQRRYGY